MENRTEKRVRCLKAGTDVKVPETETKSAQGNSMKTLQIVMEKKGYNKKKVALKMSAGCISFDKRKNM